MSTIDPRRQRRILAILVVSAVLIWIDSTVLGIALERLADPVQGLGATPGQLQWAVGIYSLLFATALFLAGALGDRYGHRTVLMLGLLIFGGASAWAAWATDPAALILARAAMGLGGALIMPPSMAIIGWTFPPERRAGAIAIWGSSAGVGVAVGPVLGGLLIDHFWWGSVFTINLPIVAFGLIGAALVLPNPRSPQRRRLDPLGLGLSTLGLLGLSYGLIEGGHQGGWDRWQVWASIAAGLVLLAGFIVSEWREREPSFDPRLFRNRRFAAGNFALAVVFLLLTGQSFYLAFYLQGARGMSALSAGLMSLPAAMGVIVGSQVGVRLAARFGVAKVSGTAVFALAACSGIEPGLRRRHPAGVGRCDRCARRSVHRYDHCPHHNRRTGDTPAGSHGRRISGQQRPSPGRQRARGRHSRHDRLVDVPAPDRADAGRTPGRRRYVGRGDPARGGEARPTGAGDGRERRLHPRHAYRGSGWCRHRLGRRCGSRARVPDPHAITIAGSGSDYA